MSLDIVEVPRRPCRWRAEYTTRMGDLHYTFRSETPWSAAVQALRHFPDPITETVFLMADLGGSKRAKTLARYENGQWHWKRFALKGSHWSAAVVGNGTVLKFEAQDIKTARIVCEAYTKVMGITEALNLLSVGGFIDVHADTYRALEWDKLREG